MKSSCEASEVTEENDSIELETRNIHKIKLETSEDGLIQFIELDGKLFTSAKKLKFEADYTRNAPKVTIEFGSDLFFDGKAQLNFNGLDSLPDSILEMLHSYFSKRLLLLNHGDE